MFNGPVSFWLRQRWPWGLALLVTIAAIALLIGVLL
jgi:hypothetical protein